MDNNNIEYMLRNTLEYNPDTGLFKWKHIRSNRCFKGWFQGHIEGSGYRVINIRGVIYRLHRVAWLFYYGSWPTDEIDHKDHDRSNNRINNLRDVNDQKQSMNRKLNKRNKTGVSGVRIIPSGKYEVRINVAYVRKHLGTFNTLAEAKAVREQAEIKYGYHPNHGR